MYALKILKNFQKNILFTSFKHITGQTFVKAKRNLTDVFLYKLGKIWNRTQYLQSNNMDNEADLMEIKI